MLLAHRDPPNSELLPRRLTASPSSQQSKLGRSGSPLEGAERKSGRYWDDPFGDLKWFTVLQNKPFACLANDFSHLETRAAPVSMLPISQSDFFFYGACRASCPWIPSQDWTSAFWGPKDVLCHEKLWFLRGWYLDYLGGIMIITIIVIPFHHQFYGTPPRQHPGWLCHRGRLCSGFRGAPDQKKTPNSIPQKTEIGKFLLKWW